MLRSNHKRNPCPVGACSFSTVCFYIIFLIFSCEGAALEAPFELVTQFKLAMQCIVMSALVIIQVFFHLLTQTKLAM